MKPQTFYVVEVAHHSTNPIHPAIYYHHCPNGYANCLFNPSYEDREYQGNKQPEDFYYFKVIREIDMTIQNDFKLVKEIKHIPTT